MDGEKIGFPCFIIIKGHLRKGIVVTEVPVDSFVSSICVELAKALGSGILPTSIDLWKVRDTMPKGGRYLFMESLLSQRNHDLSKFCDDLSDQATEFITDVFGRHTRQLKAPPLVAFINEEPTPSGGAQAATEQEAGHQEDEDVVAELEKKFRKVVRLGPASGSPSQNCKPTNYRKNQSGPTAILDGRYADTPNTIAPPVEDFHYAFASFMAEYRDENTQPPEDFVREVGELMDAVSKIGTDEIRRQSDTHTLLSNLLSVTFGQSVNTNRTSADHILTFSREGQPLGLAGLAIVEEKLELGSSGDGSVQGSFSYVQHWTNPTQKALLEACFCPSFVIAIAGPYIIICGAIFTGHAVVHRLTDYIWLANSRVNDDANAHRIARVFFALRNAVNRLRSFYAKLVKPAIPRARFFPLANRYKVGEQIIEFEYTGYLKDTEEACVTFLAVECGGDKRQIVVKFVERYGVAAHTVLAQHGFAPRLLYHGDIWLTGPEQRGCGSRKMVVMEYVEGVTAYAALYDEKKGALPDGVHSVVKRAVKLLHNGGMVHGDIRLGNVLIAKAGDGVDVGARVKIVDFDWAGTAGQVRYPLHLSKNIDWPEGATSYALITKAHDDEMVRKLGVSLQARSE